MKHLIFILFFLLFFPFISSLSAQESPDTVQAENVFFRGSHLITRDNLQEAVQAFEKAYKLDPQNTKYKSTLVIAYNNLGIKLNREGAYKEGLTYLTKALSLSGDDKEIRQNYLQIVFDVMSLPDTKLPPDEKLQIINQALEVDPENANAKKLMAALLNNSAVNKGKSGSYEDEVARLEKAAALEPSNQKIKKNLATAYFNLSTTKSKDGAYEEETELLKTALGLSLKT